jgi:uncharacterized membrane protein
MSRRLRRLRRRFRQRGLLFVLAATIRLRRLRVWLRAKVARVRILLWVLIPSMLVSAIGGLVYRNRVQWQKASAVLADKGTLPQLEIAVGAAMLGVIGIVFSLSIFSIQQVAERGTAITLREYANDWIFRIVYWTFALFALLAMLSALQRSEWALYRICLNVGMLVTVAVMLRVYFNRVINFVNPHFTITKVANRARRLLKQIQFVERSIQAEVRYERTRRRT